MLTQNWNKYKLSDVLDIKYGKDHKKVDSGDIPIYGTGGIMRYGNQFLYDGETILIPRKGSLNNIYYLKQPFWCVDTIFWSKINQQLAFPKYLYYNLKILDFASMDVGSAVPSLTTEVLKRIEIALPPIKEQIAIASILSALDDKIELNLQMNKTLEEMAMALYKHWFVDFGPFQNGKFIDSELGMIPEGWAVLKVRDYGDVITGKTPSKNFPEHFGNFRPFVTPTGFKNYRMHITESDRMISELGYIKHNRSIIPKNSVIVTCIGSDMGKVSISKVECLTNQQINSLKCDNYIFMYLFFISSYNLLKRLAGDGTTMPIINKSTFENMKVISPPKNIINRFENMVTDFDNQIESNTKENQSLTTLRDTLLPKLISGEVRVKDFDQLVAVSL